MADILKVVLLTAGIVLLQFLSSNIIEAQPLQVFFVSPTDRGECPREQHCHTLQTYLQDVGHYFRSNTTFHFLPGIHRVSWSNSTSVIIKNISDLVLSGPSSDTNLPVVSIECNWNLEFCFTEVRKLTISNIKLNKCGFSTAQSVCPMVMKGFYGMSLSNHLTFPAALKISSSHSVTLISVSVQNSYKYGMIGINVLGLFVISNCTFNNNTWGQTSEQFVKNISWPYGSYIPWQKSGGNVLLQYDDTVTQDDMWHGLKIHHSSFSYGKNYQYCSESVFHQGCGGAGVAIFIKPFFPGPLPKLYIVLEGSTFHNNIAQDGPHLLVIHDDEGYKQRVNIYVQNCTLRDGRAFGFGGAIYIFNGYPTASIDYIRIRNTNFINNSALYGGGILVTYNVRSYRKIAFSCILIKDCHFSHNQAVEGAGISVRISGSASASCVHVLDVSNVSMTHNTAKGNGGGISLELPAEFDDPAVIGDNSPSFLKEDDHTRKIIIRNSTFEDNKASSGSAISLTACAKTTILPHCTKTLQVLFVVQNVTFTSNSGCPLYLASIGYAKVITSRFISNNGSGILSKQSNIYMEGDILFAENTAGAGGAIDLACNPSSGKVSRLILLPESTITVVNNSARFGGGISASQPCSDDRWCFFQLAFFEGINSTNTTEIAMVTMQNNTASIAGDSLYGGPISDCYILTDINDVYSPVMVNISLFQLVFNFSGEPYISRVASPPYRICFCVDSSPEEYCLTNMSFNVFRGKDFHVSAIISGRTRGAYSASVRTSVTNTAELGPLQSVQQLMRSCENLTYSIRASGSNVRLHLSVEGVEKLLKSPAVINVFLLSCPLGFQEVGDPPSCSCLTWLSAVPGVTCDINTQSIHRPGNVWIGNYSGKLVAHRNCPFDYCKGANSVSVYRQNEQCALNRSGVLCGKCDQGLSLALGSSNCLHCSNVYLAIVIPFGLIGVVLLFLLLKCNLTVSAGTVNGLIFYANIVQANKTIFFPVSTKVPITHMLSVFISWVNLDLGIETCFYKGMDAYTKTWLQFAFPVYVWILILVLVYSSRYSVTVSKLTGSNAVPSLATLFLLSYSKLLRAVITAISPISITDKDGKTSFVWLVDGNVPYMTWPHAALFMMALVVVFFYIIPLTLLVLFSPLLQASSNLRLFKWVRRIGPLIDAYQGPYKVKYRYWTGVMLVVRLILFAVFSGNALGDPKVNLLSISLIIILFLTAVWNIGVLYKSYPVHLLEMFYILNLGIFSVVTMYLRETQSPQQSQEYLSCTMIGAAFLVFLVILIWHLHTFAKTFRCLRTLLDICSMKHNGHPPELELDQPQVPAVRPQPTVSVIDMSALRESLLSH